MDHYTYYSNYSDAVIGFSQYLRQEGIGIGIQQSKELATLSSSSLWFDHEYMEHGLASLLCNSPEEIEKFRIYYKRFWQEKGTRIRDASSYKNKKNLVKKAKASVVMLGTSTSNIVTEESQESKTTLGANGRDILKRTDFRQLSSFDSEELDDIAQKLVQEMSLRIKRRSKKTKHGKVDLKTSIRKNIQNGGNIIQLTRKSKTKDKFRLLVLLDVSGSMDKYSYYLLKFLWSLKLHFKQVEVFVFSTVLKRITELLDDKNLYQTLANVSDNVTHWSSGTKIGECLNSFIEDHSKRMLNGRTVTIVLSDGLDTGETEVLSEAIKKIRLKSKSLIWLNPLKGMKGYEPIQEGIKTVMPQLDVFESCHNFESLLKLENILADA